MQRKGKQKNEKPEGEVRLREALGLERDISISQIPRNRRKNSSKWSPRRIPNGLRMNMIDSIRMSICVCMVNIYYNIYIYILYSEVHSPRVRPRTHTDTTVWIYNCKFYNWPIASFYLFSDLMIIRGKLILCYDMKVIEKYYSRYSKRLLTFLQTKLMYFFEMKSIK